MPASIGKNRFGNWLAEARDWSVSRSRYWGTPLNVWICSADPEHKHAPASVAEIEKLKLQVGEQLIDPRQIALTRWADRHPDSFSSQAFLELKQEIESAGGNVQPIKVRPIRGAGADHVDGPRFELVYHFYSTTRHRRVRVKTRVAV